MAEIKRFRLMDDQGNVIVYDIAAGSITFDDRNMTLPQVVAMLEAAIEVAGQVKTVTMNGTKIEPNEETGDINLGTVLTEHQDISGKANKDELTVTDGSSADKKVIQLKSGLTLEVIVAHQDISGKVDKTDIANALDVTASGKVLDARQGKALNDLIAALQSGKSDKSATVSGLSYDTTSHKLKQTVNGTASDVMTVDTAPTANSDNPVTSGGVSTALATLLANISIGDDGYWYIGQTSTGVKAQGPKGNSVVDGDTFDIVNNLTDGGEGDALSAEMGKTLKAMIDRISAFTGYAVAASVSELPATGDATTGYIVGTHIYAYVETGGDTAGGKYQDLGDVAGAGTYVTTNGDGTFTITVGSDSYTVNLNHTHENMAKLVVCEESGLPSTLDNSTIYAITDSGETEIEKLIIRGMEFAGGGVPDTGEPMISSPSNGSTINLGNNEGSGVSKTITIKGKNLTGDLTVAVGTGLTISYGQSTGQSSVTIPMAQALLGAQVTISYAGSGALDDGSLVISHGNDVLSSVVVVVVVVPVPVALTAIKLTGTQWLQTDYYPNPNTEFELDCLFEANANTDTVGGASANLSPYFLTCEHEGDNRFNFQTGGVETAGVHDAYRIACYNNTVSTRTEISFKNNYSAFTNRSILYYKKSGSNMSLTFQGVSASPAAPLKGNTMQSKLAIGYVYYFQKMFTRFNLSIYGFKIIENGTVVRNYVPAELNGVPGLHDTINGNFISSQTAADVIPIS